MRDKTSIEDDTKHPESEGDGEGMTTLFSSDNTELTDFTERVKQAILGDDHQEQDANVQSEKSEKKKKPKLVTLAKNNVVNLFGPK